MPPRNAGTSITVTYAWGTIALRSGNPTDTSAKARCKEHFKRSRSLCDRCRVAMLRKLNDDHTSIRPQRGDFQSSLKRRRECHCYFFDSMARRSLTSHVDFGAEANTG